MRPRGLACAVCTVLMLLPPASVAAVSATDDTGQTITLPAPARRIVSLAPHATELLFAAGAGNAVVGVTEFSDYPEQARRVPSVGNGQTLDLERIVALKPDLVVGWHTGLASGQLARLEAVGIRVFRSAPSDFAAIAASLEGLGRLAGHEGAGTTAAADFRKRLTILQERYRDRRRVSVFYQIWRSPLMTLNGKHMVSSALRLCGAENVFADLPQLAPTVSEEAVVRADPEAIIASTGEQDHVLAGWKRFSGMRAVRRGNLLTVDGGLLNRAGPRVLDGTEELCRLLDEVRARR
ncbi:cobalamin-binding protein [Noviherbaspirillum aridicola]|uniref:Cobalamin-binding protein n=1 Tax=Noviherbaspirillum aridicola TaxID=2849687 RepID=A0ABQ4Q4W5_9BURK|nr:cobalamin-binding protein [Noviherbaspirillum aridicola]GIZ52149.1 cobalamin-binding protein [Noviherbaspirillum aridicola]